MADSKVFKHWPTVLLGVAVSAVLLVAVFSYQVNETEVAVITRFSQVQPQSPASGLHFRWPYPFEDVIKFDRRIRCFEGNNGKLEETRTADKQNILVGIYVNYAIEDAVKFYSTLETVNGAEDRLNSFMRSAKNAAFGSYSFDQIFSAKAADSKISEIEDNLLRHIASGMAPFGVKVSAVGIRQINLPQSIGAEIIKRMVAERSSEAQSYANKGRTEAQKIRIDADARRVEALADAEAEAKEIRASGDAKAAQYYAEFKKNPELAAFLRKLDALRAIMKTRTTLVLDTNTVPFDLFRLDADKLGK